MKTTFRIFCAGLLMVCAAGCGKNPLLKAVTSDYAPLSVGDSWTYASPDGSKRVQVSVPGMATVAGTACFREQVVDQAGNSSTQYVARNPDSLMAYDATLGTWYVDRRLPYVSGNRWNLPLAAGQLQDTRFVDGMENLGVPAGSFESCYKVRTLTVSQSAGVSSTATDLVWAAPDVGDIQMAHLDATGKVVVDYQLVQFHLVP